MYEDGHYVRSFAVIVLICAHPRHNLPIGSDSGSTATRNVVTEYTTFFCCLFKMPHTNMYAA